MKNVINRNKFLAKYLIYIFILLAFLTMSINALGIFSLDKSMDNSSYIIYGITSIMLFILMGLALYSKRKVLSDKQLKDIEKCTKLLQEEYPYSKVNVLMHEYSLGRYDKVQSFFIFNDYAVVIFEYSKAFKETLEMSEYNELGITKYTVKPGKIKLKYNMTVNYAGGEKTALIYKYYNGYIIETQIPNNKDAFERFGRIIEKSAHNLSYKTW